MKKSKTAVKVASATLVDGEKVNLNLDTVWHPKQTLVRINRTLIVGIVNPVTPKAHDSGLYLWQEVGGIYHYLGDISFYDKSKIGKDVLGVHICLVMQRKHHLESLKNQKRLSRELKVVTEADAVLHNFFGLLCSSCP